jgi:hypothetical protein
LVLLRRDAARRQVAEVGALREEKPNTLCCPPDDTANGTCNKDGKTDERVGSFNSQTIQLTITQVILDGHFYRPDLNTAPSSIVVEGPG